MKNKIFNRSQIGKWFTGMACVAICLSACNKKLDEVPQSQLAADNFYSNTDEVTAGMVGVYSQLRAVFSNGGYWGWSTLTTDEGHPPQRGSDWGDNGQWTQMHQHTWSPTHGFLRQSWDNAYYGITRANLLLEKTDATKFPVQVAEARFLRAYYYYTLIDLYGDVPLITTSVSQDTPLPRTARKTVADYIITEATAAAAILPATQSDYARVTSGAANMLLAKVYLNYNTWFNTPKYQECLTACNAVINSGQYSLTNGSAATTNYYLQNFSINYDGSVNKEYIFRVAFISVNGFGSTILNWSNHYNMYLFFGNGQSPYNGFTTLANFYNKYDNADDRKKQWLIGQQYAKDGVTKLTDRQGNPLIYTPDVPVTGANEVQGIREYKWDADPNQQSGNAGNDYAIFRLADTYLMKAEALLRLGRASTDPEVLAAVNAVRDRAFHGDVTKRYTSVTLDNLYDERGFELAWEGWRRNDAIRFGKFLLTNETKPNVSEAFRVLLPIPQSVRDNNSAITQNTGY